MSEMRINKYLAASGFCARRKADQLISAGQVFINGQRAVLGDRVSEAEEVKVGSRIIGRKNNKVYLAYHKPVGVICTAAAESPNNIISAVNYPERIFPVGRLDVHSSGLIFLTNDGDFAHCLSHPRFKHQKEYQVTVDKTVTAQLINSLKRGVNLKEGLAKADQAQKVKDKEFTLTIHQGWHRQIRRMAESLGYQVKGLKRIRIGNFDLGDLPAGKWRKLAAKEIKEFV